MGKLLRRLPYLMILCALGGLVVLIPLALGGFEVIVNFFVGLATRLVEGTMTWNMWQKIPIPVYLKIRIFNITNPRDITTGAKPILQEVGPYVYLEELEKIEIKVDEDMDEIEYRQIRHYHYQPKMSKGLETDKVTFLNIAYVGLAKLAHDFTDADYVLATLDEMLVGKGEKLTRTHTVRELMFDGFTVQSFLDLANDPLVQSAGDIKIPSILLDGKMGLLEGRNGSDDGRFVVRSGKGRPRDFGRVVRWNGMSILNKWRGKECNMVNGTDAMIYQPFLTKDSILQAFIPDLCRSLTFRFLKEIETNGIDCYRFQMVPEALYSVDRNPDNWCFCHNENMTYCGTNGVTSIASCFEGAPLYMSNPHFYGGDPVLFDGVVGLKPEYEKHVGYFDLHPLSGTSIHVRHRFQFNIELTPWIAMPTFAEASYAMVPLLWLEEGGDLDDFMTTLLQILDVGLTLWAIAKWFWMVFLVTIGFGGVALLYQRKQSSKVELLGPRPDEDDYSERDEKEPPPEYKDFD